MVVTRPQDVSSCLCGDQNRYFKPKTDILPDFNQVVFVPKPNQSSSTALRQERNRTLSVPVYQMYKQNSWHHNYVMLKWTCMQRCALHSAETSDGDGDTIHTVTRHCTIKLNLKLVKLNIMKYISTYSRSNFHNSPSFFFFFFFKFFFTFNQTKCI